MYELFFCRKSKNAISGSFYIYRNKAHFCELFVIWGGKQVFLRDERIVEDDKGVKIARISTKHSIKGWLGKMFTEDPISERNLSLSSSSSSSSTLSNSRSYWDNNVQELENYNEELLSLNLQEEVCEQDQDGVLGSSSSSSTEFNILDHTESDMVNIIFRLSNRLNSSLSSSLYILAMDLSILEPPNPLCFLLGCPKVGPLVYHGKGG